MEILVGISIFSGIIAFVGICFVIYMINDLVDDFADIIRYKKFKSGKSNVPPKYICRYNWN